MTTLTAGTRVRVNSNYGPGIGAQSDGSHERIQGLEGTVQMVRPYYVEVKIDQFGSNHRPVLLFEQRELDIV